MPIPQIEGFAKRSAALVRWLQRLCLTDQINSLLRHNQFAHGTGEMSDTFRIPTEHFSCNLSWIVA